MKKVTLIRMLEREIKEIKDMDIIYMGKEEKAIVLTKIMILDRMIELIQQLD